MPDETPSVANDYPLLWACAKNADHREAAGWSVAQGDAEAATAMREIWEARSAKPALRFTDEGSPEEPYAFIQWKGTDACFDFNCSCGAALHYDGTFAYFVQCGGCDLVWEMPLGFQPSKRLVSDRAGARDEVALRDRDPLGDS